MRSVRPLESLWRAITIFEIVLRAPGSHIIGLAQVLHKHQVTRHNIYLRKQQPPAVWRYGETRAASK